MTSLPLHQSILFNFVLCSCLLVSPLFLMVLIILFSDICSDKPSRELFFVMLRMIITIPPIFSMQSAPVPIVARQILKRAINFKLSHPVN